MKRLGSSEAWSRGKKLVRKTKAPISLRIYRKTYTALTLNYV